MPTVFLGGTLIDGTGAPPVRDAAVVVDGERLAYVGPARGAPLPQGARVLRVEGKTLMPGMVDAHIHLCGETEFNPRGAVAELIPDNAMLGAANARALLEAGFTACRDLGALGYANVALKQAIERGLLPGPRVVACGEMVLAAGSGEDDYYRPEIPFPRTGVFSGPEEARRAVRLQLYHGAGVIKLIASGRVGSSAPSGPADTEVTAEEARAVVDEAHRRGVKVAAHCYAPEAVRLCVEAGVDSIEHGTLIDEPTMALMAERGTFLVPTLSAFAKYFAPGAEERFPPYRIQRGRAVAGPQRQRFPTYLKYGIRMATGTDGVNPGTLPGDAAQELALMVELGATPMQAIVAATRNGADLLGLLERTGTLEAGKLADLIVVDGDPLADITVLRDRRRIPLVMKGGQPVRDALG